MSVQVYACYGMSFYMNALYKMGFMPYVDPSKPALFLGTYTQNDVNAMVAHKGPGYVFWNGSDALHLARHPEWQTALRKLNFQHAAHHYDLGEEVSNLVLKMVEVSPTFFHEPADYPRCFVHSRPTHFFMSTHAGRHGEYGIDAAMEVFDKLSPDLRLNVYGDPPTLKSIPRNVIVRGKYPESVMDLQTKEMQGAIRLNQHDGTSQIVIKSTLWGQWPIVTKNVDLLPSLILDRAMMKEPNTETIPGLNAFIDRIRREHDSPR